MSTTQIKVSEKRFNGEIYAVDLTFADVADVVWSRFPALDLTIAVEHGLACGAFSADVAAFLRAHMADCARMWGEDTIRVWPQSDD